MTILAGYLVKGRKDTYLIFNLGKQVDKLLDGLLCRVFRTILSTATFLSVIISDNIVTATFLAHKNKTFIIMIMDRPNSI